MRSGWPTEAFAVGAKAKDLPAGLRGRVFKLKPVPGVFRLESLQAAL